MSGYTGEWIVRVEGLVSPVEAANVDDEIRAVIATAFPHRDGRVTVLFDASRWQGGDF